MAAKRKGVGVDGRGLVLVESLLLVGLAQEVLEDAVLSWELLHPLLRIAVATALVVGTFGGALLVLRGYVQHGLEQTEQAARRFPIPRLVVHLVLLGAILFGYAWHWDDRTGAVDALVSLVGSAAGFVRASLGI